MTNRPASKNDGIATDGPRVASAGSAATALKAGQFVVGLIWAANFPLLVAGFVWVYGWGQSRGVLELVHRALAMTSANPGFLVRDPARLEQGVRIVEFAVFLVACSLAIMLASLLLGPRRYQTTRMWLIFTGLACGWLGLVMTWPAVYWFGQQHRASKLVSAAESTVTALQSHWPTMDGELPELGPFLAYPSSAPMALLPLSDASFANTRVPFSAVERTGDGVMRFELRGSELGAWLEWRKDDSEPESFVGGLETHYDVDRAARLAPHWFLVRYRANLAASG
ncbi:MAG TPA: hypothetical protein VH107_13460 [Lacipirellulaceae bacterium]|jgi:hypothetical protein|nr:hypothetical protein [Lacipirellulaceae bacterium]